MVSKLAVFLLSAATFAAAQENKCNVGKLQCCNSVQSANSDAASKQLGLLGIAVGAVQGLVGLTCNPITGIGASGTSCSAQPVCCKDNSFKGVVALGCTPININV